MISDTVINRGDHVARYDRHDRHFFGKDRLNLIKLLFSGSVIDLASLSGK